MGAVFSPDRIYRYRLTRDGAMHGSTVLFIMLNPSTADETQDDPTIRRCMAYAARWGHARLEVVNLFALRATNPMQLRLFRGDPVGPDNDRHIMEAVQDADIVIAAWGPARETAGQGRRGQADGAEHAPPALLPAPLQGRPASAPALPARRP